MDLKEFANVDSTYRDLDTGMEVPWRNYMHRIITKLGINNVKRYLPFNIEYLKEKFQQDVYFNNTPIESWDYATGFIPYIDRKTKTQQYKQTSTSFDLGGLFVKNGITCFSPSEGVSVLKETARILCEGKCK